VLISKDTSCCAAQPASPYPSAIDVKGMESGITTEIEVTLWGLHESDAEGLEVLLLGPSGRSIVLMSSYEAGRHVALNSISWGFRTLSQPVECPEPEGTFFTGNVTEPFNCGLAAPIPEPAPAGPYADRLEALAGEAGNGEWKLYVANDAGNGEGSVANGWSLKVKTNPVVPPPAPPGGQGAAEHEEWASQQEVARFGAQKREAEQAAQREREAREANEREQATRSALRPPCVVPSLVQRSLLSAKRLLIRAHCRLGHVTMHRHSQVTLVVVHQSAARGRHLASGASVAITLGRRAGRA
jgi:hypothetical protein